MNRDIADRSQDELLLKDFAYEPLNDPSSEIRLFRFLNEPEADGLIRIELTHHGLHDAGKYIPLSYVWGETTKTENIVVNNCLKKVPSSLCSLLASVKSCLRPVVERADNVSYWADAVCINQADLDEKSKQVQIMRSIYGQADEAAAWLGPAEDSQLVADLFHTIGIQWAQRCREDMGPSWESKHPDPNFGNFMVNHSELWKKDCDDHIPNTYWRSMQRFLLSSYFDRMWVYQEIILPRRIILIYGSSLIHFPTIFAAFIWYKEIKTQPRARFEGLIDPILWRRFMTGFDFRFHTIVMIRYGWLSHWKDDEVIDLEIAPLCADLKASDERDKIFGLLGLMKTRIIADYSKTAQQVYCEFVQAWHAEIGHLGILSLAGLNFRLQNWSNLDLPSWTPNWHDISQPGREGRLHRMYSWHATLYKASTGLSVKDISFSSSLRSLVLPSIILDTVTEIVPEFPFRCETPLLEWIERRRLDGSANGSNPNIPILQVMFRTALQDTYPLWDKQRLDIDAADTHMFAIDFLRFLIRREVHVKGWDDAMAINLPRLGLDPGTGFAVSYKENFFPNSNNISCLTDWTDAKTAMRMAINHSKQYPGTDMFRVGGNLRRRRIFVTKSGYVGLTISLQEDDLVAVVAGYDAPVLLRREGDHYLLVGVCFVLQLMNGEALEKVKKGEAEIDMIELR